MECYGRYMEFSVDKPPSYKQFMQNMELKMQDSEFLGDTELLLRPDADEFIFYSVQMGSGKRSKCYTNLFN